MIRIVLRILPVPRLLPVPHPLQLIALKYYLAVQLNPFPPEFRRIAWLRQISLFQAQATHLPRNPRLAGHSTHLLCQCHQCSCKEFYMKLKKMQELLADNGKRSDSWPPCKGCQVQRRKRDAAGTHENYDLTPVEMVLRTF
jgi:hypothetical protein